MVDVMIPAANPEQSRCSRQLLTLRLGLLLGISLLNSACGTADPVGMSSVTPAAALPASLSITESAGTFESIPGAAAQELVSTPGQLINESQGSALPELTQDNEDGQSEEETSDPVVTVTPSASCSADDATMQERLLLLINDARAQARSCGVTEYPATTPLAWNNVLASAASKHSADMAEHNFFSHTGSNGSSASQRATLEGYNWYTVGENIAAGRENAEQTVNDWLDSPGHCRNIMNAAFSEVAVSCVENASSDYQRYWTNMLAAPMPTR